MTAGTSPTEPTPEAVKQRFSGITARLGDADLAGFVAALRREALVDGQALLVEGTGSESLYLVWDGELVVTLDAGGVSSEVGRLGPGEMVGEVALIDPGPASATVTALGPVVVLRLSRSRLEDLVRAQPHAATAVLHALCSTIAARIRAADGKLEELNAPGLESSPSAVRENAPSTLDLFRALFGLHKKA